MEKAFSLEEYLSRTLQSDEEEKSDPMERFRQICGVIEKEFDKEWDETDDLAKNRKLEREKKAIMGFSEETEFYKEKTEKYSGKRNLKKAGTRTGIRVFPRVFLQKYTAFPVLLRGLMIWTRNTKILRPQS